jgi:hypothetical protein
MPVMPDSARGEPGGEWVPRIWFGAFQLRQVVGERGTDLGILPDLGRTRGSID